MTPDEFRRWGRAVVDWIADYQERVESLPVLSHAAPGEIRSRLPPEPSERGEPFDAILRDVKSLIPCSQNTRSRPGERAFSARGLLPSGIRRSSPMSTGGRHELRQGCHLPLP